MSYEESYNKRMGLMVLFGEYFKSVKEDLGMEKALEYAKTQIIDRAFDPPESPSTPLEVRDRRARASVSFQDFLRHLTSEYDYSNSGETS